MPRPFFKLKIGFWGLAICATLFVCGCTLTAFLGGLWWRFDLTANFRLQYLLCLLLALVVFLIGKRWPWAIVSGIFAIVNFADMLPAFVGPGKTSKPSPKSFTVLLANVLSSNKEYEQVRKLIRSVDPDIITVVEATEAWMKELSALGETYPHVLSRPREDNFGIALFSRIPFTESEAVQIGDAGVPSLFARFQVDETELTVIATHPLPPTRASTSRHRNDQLRELADLVRSVRGAVLVVGDLNTAPWSPHFKRLLRRAGLCDSRRGRGIQPTWQAGLPCFLRIPLDHVLHSSDITILRREIGPNIGSDHLPVIVEFSLTGN
jgi:endonuclease/exonuclease/phosphatase (EEP) superfamily protein YafD